MIDVESQIYTPIVEALRAQFPGILVSGEYVNAPTRFPYVSLVEQDNYTTEAHIDSGDTERFSTLMYEVNVYSDKAGGKKSVCRKSCGLWTISCTPRISGVFLYPRFPIWRTQQSTVWLPDTRLKRTEPLFIGGK